MNELHKKLLANLQGEVRTDPVSLHVYSIDASIFELVPLAVVLPKTKTDILNTMEIAREFRIPVTARGAATGITGSCLGKGIILDCSKYLNHIIDINYEKEYVTCEPGVVQNQLNIVLSKNGYRLGPDTSTGDRATLAGMLANNAAGSHSLKYGKMVDHVEAVELLLSTGDLIQFSPLSPSEYEKKRKLENIEGDIYRRIAHIIHAYKDEIIRRFPKIPRRASGYNLDELLKNPLNLSKVIAGSEGTLGIISELTMKIVPILGATSICTILFDDLLDALNQVSALLTLHPVSLELIDDQILKLGLHSPLFQGKFPWLDEHVKALLIIELEAVQQKDLLEKTQKSLNFIKQKGIGTSVYTFFKKEEKESIWNLRKAGLGILLSKRSWSRAIAFIEDISLPPSKLPLFMTEFETYMKKINKKAGIYGHAGAGCLHIRPFINLREGEEFALMQKVMLDISEMLLKYGGALSGEHGDGLIRTWLNKKMFGAPLYHAFTELKKTFDPLNLMNPGKITSQEKPFENLRIDPDTKIKKIKTFLNFEKEGGFELSVDLCNGNAACRKKEGTMCPSFQATNDEYDSTRARAQTLRSVLTGRTPLLHFTDKAVYNVLDLCIECKGCKRECPSHVDMAKMKVEFLFHYYKKHWRSIRSRLFGNIGIIQYYGSFFPTFHNWIQSSFISKKLFSFLGITNERPLPKIAKETFSKWFAKQPITSFKTTVVLFNDTFTQFNNPKIGQSAFRLLNFLGYNVILPKWKCCGKPYISKGMLEKARKRAEILVEELADYAKNGIPIIGLEPSCLFAIKNEFPDLVDDTFREKSENVAKMCTTLDKFLLNLLRQGKISLNSHQERAIKIHHHCHQKAYEGIVDLEEVLKNIPEYKVESIPSGCCGMAGSFGYEKEHYDFSMKIGHLVLFPTIRDCKEKTTIIANGFSCRSQIKQGTGQEAFHLAEILAKDILGN